jgi:hypothetical protein
MSYIGMIKSDYRKNLTANMKDLTDSIKPILDLAIKIDPSIFTNYQKMISETFKPFTDTISKLKLDIFSPEFTEVIKRNADYQSQITKSLTSVFNNMQFTDEFQKTMKRVAAIGFSEYTLSSIREATSLRVDLAKMGYGDLPEHYSNQVDKK